MQNPFLHHPKEQRKTYMQHLCFALNCSLQMIGSGFAGIIHGMFPFLFKCTVSNTLKKLTTKLDIERDIHEHIG